jgi:HAD superfamily hydrolase (TIGR01509 family)
MLRALLMDWGGVLTDGPAMVNLVHRAAAAGVRTALVTEAAAVPDDCASAFDVVALGSRKSAPEAFRQVARRLGVDPSDCVVVDDLARNLRGARAAGAVVVHHTAVARTVAEVEILLGL